MVRSDGAYVEMIGNKRACREKRNRLTKYESVIIF